MEFFSIRFRDDFLDPLMDFVLDWLLDKMTIIETNLLKSFVVLIEDYGGNVFKQNCEIVLGGVVVLELVIQFVGVGLVPDEIKNGKDYEY